jgi:hypothetical protein
MGPVKATKSAGQKLAYSYRRFSSRRQEQGSSLARQLEMAQEVCTANGWQLVDLPPDEGVSAYKVNGDDLMAANMHKGNLGAFLERVQAGQIRPGSVLIVERLDRFSRNFYDIVFPVWLNLLQSDIEIYSCVTHTHYTLEAIRKNPMLAGMALIEMANANEYSSGMAKRVGKAISLRLAECSKGRKMNLGPWKPLWLDFSGKKGESGTYTLNAHAETVRRIVSEYIAGNGMSRIAKGLIRDRIPNLRHGRWNQGTVSHLLKSEALTGNQTVNGVTLKRIYPAVVSEAQYTELGAKLAENRNRRGGNPRGDRIDNLFRGRVRCLHCGTTMTSNHHYYRCRAKAVGQCKVRGCVRSARLEEDFFMLFLQEQPSVLLGKNTVKSNGAAAHLKTRIRQLDQAIEDATALIGKMPIKAVETKLTALVKERETAGKELEAINLRMLSSAAAPVAFENIRQTLSAFVNLPKDHAGTPEEAALVKAIEQLREQLADNEVRKKLLNLLPTLVNHLVVDVEKKRYRIVNHAGEKSEWRRCW